MKKITQTLSIFLLLLSFGLHSQTKTLSKAQYRDKTLAMILGSIGGAVTGYEYLNVYNTPNGYYQPGATMKTPKEPLLGMPDSWFILLNGTLGGTTKDEYNYGSWFSEGKMNSDDDQHIDFFNQYLLNKYGLGISFEDIKGEWMSKQVSDFGGGQGAIEVMRDKNLMAPQCGHRDHGNRGHWLPECYIEHETMGAAFPGMPNKSVEFTQRFSSMTGEGENVQWGYYWSAAHSVAYFETDIRVAVTKALGMLPANSRPRQMYDICVSLHKKYPTDWRAAVRELWKSNWSAPFAVGYDGVMMLSDVNNGTAFLSILYGQNDYMTTLKIVSIAGGDGDCTASSVCGLMGLIKGMAGTPAAFKDRIYKNNQGVWINDVVHAFSIKKDYKLEWKYDEIVDMYQKNAESTIRAYGGIVTSSGYTILSQSSSVPQIGTVNWDFEKGTLEGWKTWTTGGSASIWNERQCNDNTQACFAATGKHKGTVSTASTTAEAKLFQTVTGLKPGATYIIEGRIHTASGREARLFVDNYGGPYKYASISKGVSPFPYMYLYVKMGATNTTLDIGLHAPPTTNGSTWCSIDDIIITEMESPAAAILYEAEAAVKSNAVLLSNASASGGQYIGGMDSDNSYLEFTVSASYSGEHIVRINYANAGDFATHKISVNGKFVGLLEHSDTGPWGKFSANVTDAYVKLNKGNNVIRIAKDQNAVEIDYIEVLSPYGAGEKPSDDAALVSTGIYKIVARHSGKVLDLKDGNSANGGQLIQNTFTGSSTQYFRITKTGGVYFIAPINNEAAAVEILGAGVDNTNPVGLWGYWSGDSQQWAIQEVGNGYCKILNYKSGKAMDVIGGSMADGATVFQYDYLNGLNQQWRFDFVGMTPNDIAKAIPGKIEAESYTTMLGIQTQATTDIGGGENIGWIESGDWMDYKVMVESAGAYQVEFRMASLSSTGQISLKVGNAPAVNTTLAPTGGWQTWKSVSNIVTLQAGLQTMRLQAVAGGFNLNWISFTKKLGNIPPLVSITTPVMGTSLVEPANPMVRVTASDNDGTISFVRLYLNNALVRTDATAPYEWSSLDSLLKNLPAGKYLLKAVAQDNAGATSSAEVSFTVTVKDVINQVPVLTITAPANNASYLAPANINIAANATDADGTISRVDFYNGNTLLGSDATAPYNWSWTGVAAGSYTIQVTARDNVGASVSKSITVTVTSPVTTTGINGPACVTAGSTVAYTLVPEVPAGTVSWWSNSAASTTPNATDSKKVTVQIPAFMNGTTFTLYAGANFTSSPWYKEYTKTIKVGACPAKVAALASPQPFEDETTLSLDNGQIIESVMVFDSRGILVYEEQGVNKTEMILGSQLANGIYTVQIVSEDGVSVMRLMKSK